MLRQKIKKCINCNKDCFPWTKEGLCRFCFLAGSKSKPLKKSHIKKISDKGKEKKKQKAELKKQMFEEFRNFYNNHETKTCYECDKFIHESVFSSMNVHHVLPKSRYPEYTLEHWNFLLLCPYHHQRCEQDITKTPKVEEKTKDLKEIFG